MFASPFSIPWVKAQGEHARRIAAELVVLSDDLRLLQSNTTTAHHTDGLRQRIRGAINGLDILSRLADQALGRPVQSRHQLVLSLRRDFDEGRTAAVELAVDALKQGFPLAVPDIDIADANDFAGLHSELCAACHDNPDLTVQRPAYNLMRQAAHSSDSVMFARLLVGVRGERVTGIDNPLTDFQLMGLLDYYRSAAQ